MNASVLSRIWQITEPLVVSEGMEIVDIDLRREGRGTVLRFFLDRQGGVTIDDLTRVSRQVSDLLDVHDVVPGAFTLEVSSPGINRRLRRPDHFRRFLGQRVRVRTITPLNGRRVFTGALDGVDDDGIRVVDPVGTHFIRFPEIAQANYEAEL